MTTAQRNPLKTLSRKLRQHVLRLVFDHKTPATLDLERPVSILFDQKENLIGDMIVNTLAFRAIKARYPQWKIHVLAGADNSEIVKNNPHVDRMHIYHGLWASIRELRREHLGIYYCNKSRLGLHEFALARYAGARINIGRNQHGLRLFDYSIDAPSETEAQRFLRLLELLGIDRADTRYEIYLSEDEIARANSYLAGLTGHPVIVFNRFGNPRGKLFSAIRSKQLVDGIRRVYPEAAVVLLHPPAARSATVRLQHELGFPRTYVPAWTRSIRDTAALICQADLVVTPDTSIVHIACAFDRPLICVYRQQAELSLWRPLSDKAIALLPLPPSRDVDDVPTAEFDDALKRMRHRIGETRGGND